MPGAVAAIVVAGGRGVRAGGDLPKQYRMIGGSSCAAPQPAAVRRPTPKYELVQPVIHPRRRPPVSARPPTACRLLPPVVGGATRQASVLRRAGGACAPHAPDIVLVHDAARPFASAALISRAIAAGRGRRRHPGPAGHRHDQGGRRDRPGRRRRSTARACAPCRRRRPSPSPPSSPRIARRARPGATTSPTMPRWPNGPAWRSACSRARPATSSSPRRRISRAPSARASRRSGDVRTGAGFDVHAFSAGDHVRLGGVRIPHDRGVAGHSDADVALHALVDAILGALADGDIGTHFPPSDPQWRGASSDRFLAFAVERVRAARRPDRASRRHDRLRGAADRPASRRDARAHRRDCRDRARPRRRQGDHQREARLHRPARGHRRLCDRDRPAALDRAVSETGAALAQAAVTPDALGKAAGASSRYAGTAASPSRPRSPAPAASSRRR